MGSTFTIAGKEIKSGFVTPLAYVIISSFLLLAGFFFFSLLQQFNTFIRQASVLSGVTPSLNQWVISPYFRTLEIILIFLIPVLTMRSLAEEKQSTTFELLLTSPLSLKEIVFGKFIGVTAVILAMITLSFVFPLVSVIFLDPEFMPIVVGLVGLLLLGMSFSALGLAVSAFTSSQTVAGVVSLVLFLLLYALDTPAEKIGGSFGFVLNYLAPVNHSEGFFRGVIEGADIVYFVSLTALGLFVTARALEASRWR